MYAPSWGREAVISRSRDSNAYIYTKFSTCTKFSTRFRHARNSRASMYLGVTFCLMQQVQQATVGIEPRAAVIGDVPTVYTQGLLQSLCCTKVC